MSQHDFSAAWVRSGVLLLRTLRVLALCADSVERARKSCQEAQRLRDSAQRNAGNGAPTSAAATAKLPAQQEKSRATWHLSFTQRP